MSRGSLGQPLSAQYQLTVAARYHRDQDPSERWRVTHGCLTLLSDVYQLHTQAKSKQPEQAAGWCRVLNDAELGRTLCKLLLSIWDPVTIHQPWTKIVNDLLEMLLSLLLKMLRCSELRNAISELISKDFSAENSTGSLLAIDGVFDTNGVEEVSSSSGIKPADVIGDIAKYVASPDFSGGPAAWASQLALRVLRQLTQEGGHPRGGKMIPLHQWLSVQKVRGAPDWKEIVSRLTGGFTDLTSNQYHNPALPALLLKLARVALTTGNALSARCCLTIRLLLAHCWLRQLVGTASLS